VTLPERSGRFAIQEDNGRWALLAVPVKNQNPKTWDADKI